MVFLSKEPGPWVDGMLFDIMWLPQSSGIVTDLVSDLVAVPGPILDIGAGTGRHALPLALEGFDVTCVEPSTAMRTALLAKIAASADLRERVTVLPSDACTFRVNRRFTLAYAIEMSGYLDDDAFAEALRRVREHLAPGGLLIIDGLDAEESVRNSDWVLECRRAVGHATVEMWWKYEDVSPTGCTLVTSYRCRGDVHAEAVDRRYKLFLRSRERTLEIFSDAGLEVVDEINLRGGVSTDTKNVALVRRPEDG